MNTNGFYSLPLFLSPLNAHVGFEQVLLPKDMCNQRPRTVGIGIYSIFICKKVVGC